MLSGSNSSELRNLSIRLIDTQACITNVIIIGNMAWLDGKAISTDFEKSFDEKLNSPWEIEEC